jgi:hypothetical protein
MLGVVDEFAGLRQRRPCAAAECPEEVAFSIFAGAVGQDEATYHGTCADGHHNRLMAGSGHQSVEDEV